MNKFTITNGIDINNVIKFPKKHKLQVETLVDDAIMTYAFKSGWRKNFVTFEADMSYEQLTAHIKRSAV